MPSVRYEEVTRTYSKEKPPAVDKFTLEIKDGEFLVLVGPSGSGKTTALRMVAGLEPVDSGKIFIGDKDITGILPKNRDIAMVFQSYALYPQKTVAENIGFALKMQKVPKQERQKKVLEVATLLGLEQFLDRKPKELSGGQRQRVAMGRAIIREPAVFLMDEPLSNLDAKLRVQTRTQIAELQRRLKVTTIYVTHDQIEAMTMGDRVAVLKDGLLQQCGSPRELYENPINLFVAGFIGSPTMNLHKAILDKDRVLLGNFNIQIKNRAIEIARKNGLQEIVLGIRPEHLKISDPYACDMRGEVSLIEELGADAFIYIRIEKDKYPIIVRVNGESPFSIGDEVGLHIEDSHLFVFDPHSGNRIEDISNG